jgi:hypothetical protein
MRSPRTLAIDSGVRRASLEPEARRGGAGHDVAILAA